MKNICLRFLLVVSAVVVGGCATVSRPIFDSEHPANASAPSAAQGNSPGTLSRYRDDAAISNSTGSSKSEKPVGKDPNEHGGAHGKQ